MRPTLLALCALVSLSLVGCFGSSTPLVTSVAAFRVSALPSIVAQKIDAPLYIVATPSDFPDKYRVEGLEIAVFSIPPVDLTETRAFVTQHLSAALGSYFNSVVVVDDEAKLPAAPHVRCQIKLGKIEYDRRVTMGHNGQRNELYAAMEWAAAIRRHDAQSFVFSFAERTTSSKQMTGFSDTSQWQDLFNEALRHLLSEYNKQSIQQKLMLPGQ